jgi:hypothetical protein
MAVVARGVAWVWVRAGEVELCVVCCVTGIVLFNKNKDLLIPISHQPCLAVAFCFFFRPFFRYSAPSKAISKALSALAAWRGVAVAVPSRPWRGPN